MMNTEDASPKRIRDLAMKLLLIYRLPYLVPKALPVGADLGTR